MRKPAFCIGANQLHGDRATDQCLCFPYIDSTILLLPKSEISSPLWFHNPFCVGRCLIGNSEAGSLVMLLKLTTLLESVEEKKWT